jgi:hypothetical protein
MTLNRSVSVVALAGVLLGLAVAFRLALVLPEVPNRHALTYDAGGGRW